MVVQYTRVYIGCCSGGPWADRWMAWSRPQRMLLKRGVTPTTGTYIWSQGVWVWKPIQQLR